MEQCREYTSTDNRYTQKKSRYGWNEDCKNSLNNGDKESLSIINLSDGKDSTALLILKLRNLRKYHPPLWERLKEMDERAREQFGANSYGQFKQRWSVEGLEARFAQEEKARLILP